MRLVTRLDPRRLAVKVLLAPFGLVIPHFWPPYGSGLSTFIRADLAIAGDVEKSAYGICDGWFGNRADCWANKGWLRTGVRTPGGLEIDFYDTHLDAGSSRDSNAARGRQLDVLAAAIEKAPRDRAVLSRRCRWLRCLYESQRGNLQGRFRAAWRRAVQPLDRYGEDRA